MSYRSSNSHKNRRIFTCQKCGIPNISGDKRCMNCGTSLNSLSMALEKLKHLFQGIFPQKKRAAAQAARSSLKQSSLTTALIGGGTTLLGLYFFAQGMSRGSFQDWLIAILCLLYGGTLLKKLFRP